MFIKFLFNFAVLKVLLKVPLRQTLKTMDIGVEVNKEKIGNLLIYLAVHLNPLFHTKLIKLLYLIDENAVRDCGVPVTWLDYKVWQYGPVAPVIYEIH